MLSSHEALNLTASFAVIAERMRICDNHSQARAALCDVASRVAFLRAHALAKQEEMYPAIEQCLRRVAVAVI